MVTWLQHWKLHSSESDINLQMPNGFAAVFFHNMDKYKTIFMNISRAHADFMSFPQSPRACSMLDTFLQFHAYTPFLLGPHSSKRLIAGTPSLQNGSAWSQLERSTHFLGVYSLINILTMLQRAALMHEETCTVVWNGGGGGGAGDDAFACLRRQEILSHWNTHFHTVNP